jgi:putative oxidoreductase
MLVKRHDKLIDQYRGQRIEAECAMGTSRPVTIIPAIVEIAGKVLISSLFWWDGVLQGLMTWPDVVSYVAAQGLPMPALVGAGATAFQSLAPIGLFFRRFEPWAALALAGYCLLTAVLFHNFWTLGGDERILAQIQFLKNMAIAGALLVVVSRN